MEEDEIGLFGYQKGRRCAYRMRNGQRCGAPAMRDGELCYTHDCAARIRPKKVELPPVYDAGSFRVAVREVMRGLLEGAIDEKTAGKLLYGLQMERRDR
jgi:hypothetical protein